MFITNGCFAELIYCDRLLFCLQVFLWLGKDAAWNILSPAMYDLCPGDVVSLKLNRRRTYKIFLYVPFWRRWLPFSITTVLVGADFIVMTSRVREGLVDHVHQASDALPHIVLWPSAVGSEISRCPFLLEKIVQCTWILSNFAWVWGDLFHPNAVVCPLTNFSCDGDRSAVLSSYFMNLSSTKRPMNSQLTCGSIIRFRLASSWLCILCIIQLLCLLLLLLWQRCWNSSDA